MQTIDRHLLPTFGLPKPGLGRRLPALAGVLGGWLRQRAERWRLARLDDRMLQDLGLTRGDVEREFARPFWQPMDTAALELARRNAGPRLGGRPGWGKCPQRP
jgi:uncharacterized protein YjiS (DUF1127 family)